jgi:hypothetical protein
MRTNHLLIFIAVALVAAASLVAGCTTLTGNEQKSYTPPASDYGTGTGYPAGYAGESGYYPQPYPTIAPDASSDIANRKVIMTAYVQVETAKFDEAVSQVRAMAPAAGGYVQSSSMDTYGDKRKTGTITLKVPQSKYEDILRDVRKLGTVKADRSTGSDVTGKYVDLEARLKNAKASEERLLDIMGDTKNVTEVLAVEKELMRVQGEIESLTAQLRTLNSQVDFATITVYLTEPEPVVSYDWGIGEAVAEAAHAFIGMIGGLIVLTGYLIPLVIYFLLILAALYLCIKGALWLYNRPKQPKRPAGEKKP